MKVRFFLSIAVLGSFAAAMLGSVASGAGGKTVDLYSSLPLQGASKAQSGRAGQRHQALPVAGAATAPVR